MVTQHATPGTESVALQSMHGRTVQFIKTKLRAMQPVFTEQFSEGSITTTWMPVRITAYRKLMGEMISETTPVHTPCFSLSRSPTTLIASTAMTIPHFLTTRFLHIGSNFSTFTSRVSSSPHSSMPVCTAPTICLPWACYATAMDLRWDCDVAMRLAVG